MHGLLTDRQAEVVRFVCAGLAEREIAARLCIWEGLVRTRLSRRRR